MKNTHIVGYNKRKRLSGMLASFAQIVLGTGFVSSFFKEEAYSLRFGAFMFFLFCFSVAIITEPNNKLGGE